MGAIFAFRCRNCGELHEGAPSFGFAAPIYYEQLDDAERTAARLTRDTCVIPHEHGADRFVRTVLEVPIHGSAEPFLWGIWVSLSESSFARCMATWDDPDESDVWFGWFSNRLPWYPDTLNLKSRVHPRKGGVRPFLDLERNGHPLAEHLHTGLQVSEAQEIAEHVLHRI